MDSYSESKKKVDNFRQQIRREKIDNIFAQQRELMLQPKETQLTIELRQSVAKQKEYLDKCSLALTGQPNQQWQIVIQKLKSITLAFKGEFEYWFTCSIINSLAMAIKESHFQLNLTPAICSLFSDMVCLSSQHAGNFTEKLMEYEIIPAAVREGSNINYTLRNRNKILNFCGNLCAYFSGYKKQFIKEGGGPWLIEMGEQVARSAIENQQICQFYLSSAKSIVSINSQQGQYQLPNLNIVVKLLPIAANFILDANCSHIIISLSLSLLCQILKYDKDFLYQNIMHCQVLINKIIFLVNHQNRSVRYHSLIAICSLTYSDSLEIPKELLDKGILDQIYAAQNNPTGNQNSRYQRIVINTLSNLAASSEKASQSILNHPVFQIILATIQSQQIKIKSDCFYCLNTIIQKIMPNSFIKLTQNFDILRYLVLGINDTRQVSGQILIDILSTIISIVSKSNKMYSPKSNWIIQQLQNTYRITSVLENILQNTKNELALPYANRLHEMISSSLWNHDLL